MAEPILYSFYKSAASYRLRIALNYRGIKYQQIEVDLHGSQQKTPTYKKINPSQKVPALVIDGHTLTESLPICEYLEETRKTKPLLPHDQFERFLVRRFCEQINAGTQPYVSSSAWLKIEEYGQNRKEWSQHYLNKALPIIEELLQTSNGKFCFGNQVTMADAFLIPQLYTAHTFEIDYTKYPKINAINSHLNTLQPFIAAHPDNQAKDHPFKP